MIVCSFAAIVRRANHGDRALPTAEGSSCARFTAKQRAVEGAGNIRVGFDLRGIARRVELDLAAFAHGMTRIRWSLVVLVPVALALVIYSGLGTSSSPTA
jgi:hypothetical protein